MILIHLSNGVFPIFCHEISATALAGRFCVARGMRDTKIQIIEVSVSSLHVLSLLCDLGQLYSLNSVSCMHACRYLLIFSGQSLPTVVKIQQRKIKSSQWLKIFAIYVKCGFFWRQKRVRNLYTSGIIVRKKQIYKKSPSVKVSEIL
jgi:hypothetical protein